jgi:Cytochrome P460
LSSQKALDDRSLSRDFLPAPDDEIGWLFGGPTKSVSTPASEREALQMDKKIIPAIAIVATSLAVLGGRAISAQDRYALEVPGGMAFSEFRGYEDWQTVAVSQNGKTIETILGNPAMIEAYKSGIPGNGKPFPDGAKFAKIHWTARKADDQPGEPLVPGALHDIDFMQKDSKRFADSGGWGYAEFEYDAASDAFRPGNENDSPPQERDAKCGFACHTIVAAKDYVFTAYPKR